MADLKDIINNGNDYISNGIGSYTVDGYTFTGYGDKYMFTWEKTYPKSLERASDGSIGNMDTYATFRTPRLKVTYPIMAITDFREMMKQYLDKNEYSVTCYDNIYDKITTNQMYYATPAEPEYYYRTAEDGKVECLGVINYTVELIGTNNK